MKKNEIARRSFLKKLGLTGMTLPFLGDLALAEEIDESPIRRLILIEHPDGINPEHWYPTGSEKDFTLPSMTEPFNLVKNDCVFLEGINLSGLAGHGAYAGLWKGGTTGTSIDQYFAEKWRGKTDVTSLVHKASDLYAGSRSLAYDSFGVLIPASVNPLTILDKIYTSSDIEAKKYNSLEASKRRLATISADLESLMDNGMHDNELFQSHEKALTDILNRLNAQTDEVTSLNMDQWKADFEATAVAGGLTSRDESRWRGNGILAEPSAFELMSGLHEDAIVTALKYDRTRVVNYSYGTDTWDFYMECEDGNSYPYHNAGHDMNQGHIETRKVTSRRVANLIKTLKETTDIYGEPLLDSTLVVYACEIGHAANHTNKNVPFILAGAGLEGGRYLKYNGVLWNKVLVSIANILGDDLISFGTTDAEGGGLDGLV
ncbi:MAG: Unknown protein [uncultured Sulfurovum sp.]|uniref:Tat (Twin-arginine translocation) pathway signal sequence domain protein n=1 Tax=uncultured Sulfurovum sp. TaxID=269237 RepID=A0A6S6SB66_9BACT|nr:MAG: Unknown protein [uncultured Sulfurovum sp.]